MHAVFIDWVLEIGMLEREKRIDLHPVIVVFAGVLKWAVTCQQISHLSAVHKGAANIIIRDDV